MSAKQSIDFDGLGEKHKALERISAGQKLIPEVPTIARLDGRAFHTFLRDADKPFDSRVVRAMQETAKELLDKFNAEVAYVQSDEITLVWKSCPIFDGKVQKVLSTTAALASVVFDREIYEETGMRKGPIPTFDCRVWQVPDLETAAENILWREMDATKNSISMMASAHFSEKQLDGISTKKRLIMLEGIDVHWENLPHYLKRGTYYQKVERWKVITDEEMVEIPEKHRPIAPVLRNVIEMQPYPPATTISNFAGVLFNNETVEFHKEEP